MNDAKKYTISTAMSCSTSLKEIMPPETLVNLLSGRKALDKQWVHHITVLFSEIPPAYLAHTLAENGLSYKDAEKLYACLPPVLQYRPIQKHEDIIKEQTQDKNIYKEIDEALMADDMDKFIELSKQAPLPPEVAMTFKTGFGAKFIKNSEFNLSAAEKAYGKDWLS